MKRDIANSTLIGVWVLALGAVGFACGFFGPIALNPDANQGPLLGIFITGPGGVVAGLVAGAGGKGRDGGLGEAHRGGHMEPAAEGVEERHRAHAAGRSRRGARHVCDAVARHLRESETVEQGDSIRGRVAGRDRVAAVLCAGRGAACDAYLKTGRQTYLPTSDTASAWPPDLLPNYLGLQVLGAVPGEFQGFAGE